MWRKLVILSFLLFLIQPILHAESDSIGFQQKGKLKFIIHEVDKGETLYSLSKRYDCSVDDIIKQNPSAKSGLSIGEKLKIPYYKQPSKPSGQPQAKNYHIVGPHETLYSISRKYNISVAELKSWNNLTSNEINVGDKLLIKSNGNSAVVVKVAPSDNKTHTVAIGETLYSISRKYNVSTQNIVKWNNLNGNAINVGQKLYVSDPDNTSTVVSTNTSMLPGTQQENNTSKDIKMQSRHDSGKNDQTSNDTNYDDTGDINTGGKEENKITENGLAEVIKGSTDSKKYLALHRTAPIGTIMQVRNEMNNQFVFVRVVGTIPDISDNKNVMIKISKKAYERLGAVDARFPVEISYIPY